MKRVFRQARLAQNQAKRVFARNQKSQLREKVIEKRRLESAQLKLLNNDIRKARKAWKEDWLMGPLAPRRDVGTDRLYYGTMNQVRGQFPVVPKNRKRKFMNIVEGDRVVIVAKNSRDKGKIGVVSNLDSETETVTVRNMNRVDFKIPEYLRDNNDQFTSDAGHMTLDAPLPLDDVRLVVKLVDPVTKAARDVIVEEMYEQDKHAESDYGSSKPYWSRWIKGLDIHIPWPEMEPQETTQNVCDTLRIDVEERTWVPSLLHPPGPRTVLDELRHKNSKYRDRWSEGFIEHMEKKEAAEKSKPKGQLHMIADPRMLTPNQLLMRRKAEERAAMPPPELTDDMLAKIGEVMMASKRQSA